MIAVISTMGEHGPCAVVCWALGLRWMGGSGVECDVGDVVVASGVEMTGGAGDTRILEAGHEWVDSWALARGFEFGERCACGGAEDALLAHPPGLSPSDTERRVSLEGGPPLLVAWEGAGARRGRGCCIVCRLCCR